MAQKKTIITAAVTGAWPKKENNPNVPMTPAEIADDVYACWKAGAAIAHLHMRDDEGNGTMDTAKFEETVNLIKTKYPDCDIILNLTTSGDIHADDEQIKNVGGYDHNYVLKTDGKFAKVASMTGAKSGIVMDVYTDMPGMQVYTANGTTIECGKNKSSYKPFCGAFFETQFFPDSIHHENFKSCILKANTKFTTVTEYRFHTV